MYYDDDNFFYCGFKWLSNIHPTITRIIRDDLCQFQFSQILGRKPSQGKVAKFRQEYSRNTYGSSLKHRMLSKTLMRMEKKRKSSRWLSPTPTQSTKLISWLALQLCFRISLALQNFLKLADQLFQGREIRREIISMMSKAPTPMRKKHSSLSSTSSSTYLLLHTIATRGLKATEAAIYM